MLKRLKGLTLMVSIAGVVWAALESPPTGGQAAGQTAAGISAPAWLESEPLIIVGNWDSMPIFRHRVGGGTTWQEEDYRKEHGAFTKT